MKYFSDFGDERLKWQSSTEGIVKYNNREFFQTFFLTQNILQIRNITLLKVFLSFVCLVVILSSHISVQAGNKDIFIDASLTDPYYQMFRNFYYDALYRIFELMDSDKTVFSLEELKHLSTEQQSLTCAIAVDYSICHSVITRSFLEAFGQENMNFLFKKLVVDLSGFEWDLVTPLSPEDEEKLHASGYSIHDDMVIRLDAIDERNKYCLEKHPHLVERLVSPYHLLGGYNTVPVEFQLRDLYVSFIPFIQWIQEYIPSSEQKDHLQIFVESLKRKYLLTF